MKRVPSKTDLKKCAVPRPRAGTLATEVAKEAANLLISSSTILSSHETASVVVLGAAISMVASSASLYSLASSMDDDN